MSRPSKMTQKRFQALHDAISRGLDEWAAEADDMIGYDGEVDPGLRAEHRELIERIDLAWAAQMILHDRFPEQTKGLDR